MKPTWKLPNLNSPKANRNLESKPTNPGWILASLGVILSSTFAFTGCGRQAYIVGSSNLESEAPGFYLVPRKVDIALFEDNSGSRFAANEQIVPQLRAFLNTLPSKRWDYHFLSSPINLTDPSARITQAAASQFDSNWGSLWAAPYPGAQRNAPGTLLASIFRTPENYNGFIATSGISNSFDGEEPAFNTIVNTLTRRVEGTNFMRSDALLVILTLSNDDDTSGIDLSCRRSDGLPIPCPGSETASYTSYLSQIRALKSNPNQLRFYSLVPQRNESSCLGGSAAEGVRYRNMSLALGGQSYDICRESLSTIFGRLDAELEEIRQGYTTQYIFLPGAPDTAQLQIFLTRDGVRREIHHADSSRTFGWEYQDYQTGVYTIIEPIPMNQASGYAVRLYGDDRPRGSDTISVEHFYPAGAQDSVAD